ncbi:MAG: glycosyltransferase family 2 protein [Coriobacteriaceae bacterium]|nr:glycosyltransferase family 2 protein [Coriobacteriaceae bacterium]
MSVVQGPLVSIITPAYNAERDLECCLIGILGQTYENFEAVIVDDGSTDGTADLADAIAQSDERVRVLHIENGGPAVARNAGLDEARGSWITFVDADDLINPTYLERLARVQSETKADIVISDCMMVEHGNERRFGMAVPDRIYRFRDDLWRAFLDDKIPWSLWGKLYRASLFEGIRADPDDYIAEDLDMNARIFARDELCVATTDEAGYFYTMRAGSVDQSFTERHLCQFDVFERVFEQAVELDETLAGRAAVFYEERVLSCLRKAIDAKALDPQTTSAFREALAAHRSDVLSDKDAPGALKRRLVASMLGPHAYSVLRHVFG